MATLPFTTPPMPAVARILSRYDRPKLEAFLSIAIDLLDTLDGEPDVEEDDPSGQCERTKLTPTLSLLPATARQAVRSRTMTSSTTAARRRMGTETPFTRSSPYPR